MNPRIKKVEALLPHTLLLTFTNSEVKEFDMSEYLHYPVFISLQDEALFKQATVFNGTVCWNDVIDFDPDTLYLESKQVELIK